MTANRLAETTSPYLLQHKDNPVHWYPWGPEALQAAQEQNKPILLSVGYAACHWCHVMAHESFEDPDTAEVMNRLFINIKVDREERPDIDQIYMRALHALGEQGGWPLTMFLTAKGEPFWGGTYFPKTAQWGRPSFVQVLESVSNTYKSDRDRIETNRSGLMQAITPKPSEKAEMDVGLILAAGEKMLSLFDPQHGGIRGAPKFPQASVMDLIWRVALRSDNAAAHQAFLHTLKQISNGGIYDHLRGGIARYSVDHLWLAPHFEKMLYDNGQYLTQLAIAYRTTGDELFRRRIEETADWLIEEMQLEGGAFASSLDADSEGVEGRFYVWSAEEVTEVLGKEDGLTFSHAYDVHPSGNWEGVTILNRLKVGLLPTEEEDYLASLRAKLLERRGARIRPEQDDKVLADWNALAIIGLARAGASVSRESYIDAAVRAYDFIMQTMCRDDHLAHSWRAGEMVFPGFASDHAAMMEAALTLAEIRPAQASRYLKDAARLGQALKASYHREQGAYFMTAQNAEALIQRPFSIADEAVPNANAQAASAFSRLYAMTGDPAYRELADDIFITIAAEVPKNVFATASLLAAFDTRMHGKLIVIIRPNDTEPNPFSVVLDAHNDPANAVLIVSQSHDFPADHPAHGKTALDGKPTAYVCREGTCSAPVQSSEDLAALLSN
ncbi:thioredoxin domain-containing protein [Roseibium sp. CAU 1637]|uniref:Thioredoxin domain-containing protein n=1 Tax=Roseibium limicola TaxID=2816037 RepID=A0A939JB72_9HYPH|nr:thioredoxin domain-containing protein [Roseibium limicola]MBO0347153.1 thioredoxin domain-containing protein [Roseibium limicola]